jgi:hypothetical protein
MSTRSAAWIAWASWALSMALTVLSIWLLVLSLSQPSVHIFVHWIEAIVLAVGFSTVGALVAPRHPQNPMGWIFCAVGLLYAAVHFVAQYATYALLAVPGSLPGGEAAAWVFSWLFVPQIGLTGLLALLFPDGRVQSIGWRWFAWLIVLATPASMVVAALSPGEIVGLEPIHNPLGIEGLPNLYELVQALMLTLLLVAAGSQLVRLRRARGVEQQQIKWFAYAAVVASTGSILTYVVPVAIDAPLLGLVSYVPFVVGVVSVPISMGIAILRHRLYDIDLLINRTLVYGTLTVTLVTLYFGGIVVLQRVFVLLTGQQSTLAVVASTLVIAALFTPLRRRIQGFIDRRFYRTKYDARETLEVFSAQLRNETDLEALSDDLVGVVKDTMQPAHVSLWLRPETAQNGKQPEQ